MVTLLGTSDCSTGVNISGVGTTVGESGAIPCSALRNCRITVDSFPKVGGAVVDTLGMSVGSTDAFCSDVSMLVLSRFG